MSWRAWRDGNLFSNINVLMEGRRMDALLGNWLSWLFREPLRLDFCDSYVVTLAPPHSNSAYHLNERIESNDSFTKTVNPMLSSLTILQLQERKLKKSDGEL